jgi:hypothetical protein
LVTDPVIMDVILVQKVLTNTRVCYIGDDISYNSNLSLLQEVVTHVTELRKTPYCMTISVCP